jgi:hypothetical protein
LSLSERRRAHVTALSPVSPEQAPAARLARARAYIGDALRRAGYTVHDGAGSATGRSIEAELSNTAAAGPAARTFIVGARVDGGQDAAGGAAAVLELARLLAPVEPSRGTAIRFVFFLAPPAAPAADAANAGLDDLARLLGAGTGADERPGSFIAYVGSLASSRQVQDALSAFQSMPNLPAHGLATPAYMQGVTLSDRATRHPAGGGLPALVLTDTSFTRFPYRQAADMPTGTAAAPGPDEVAEQAVFAGMARVVHGLARTLAALAAGQRG